MDLFEALDILLPKKPKPVKPTVVEDSGGEKKPFNKNQKYEKKSYGNKPYDKKPYEKKAFSNDSPKQTYDKPDSTVSSSGTNNEGSAPKKKFIKTDSAFVLYIASAHELSVLINKEKTQINISGLEEIYEAHAENAVAFQKFVKNNLYQTFKADNGNPKIYLRFDEGSTTDAQIYFDFECKKSLLSHLTEAAKNFNPVQSSSAKQSFKF